MVQHVTLDLVAAIGNGFAAREFAARFDIDVHQRRGDQRSVDGYAYGQRVVHRRASITKFFGKLDQKFCYAVHEVVDRAVSLPQQLDMFACEERLVADVEADHGQRPAGLKHDLRGFWIIIDVGFRGGVYVAAFDRATHQDDLFDQRHDRRIFLDGERDIGERADGN